MTRIHRQPERWQRRRRLPVRVGAQVRVERRHRRGAQPGDDRGLLCGGQQLVSALSSRNLLHTLCRICSFRLRGISLKIAGPFIVTDGGMESVADLSTSSALDRYRIFNQLEEL